MGIMFVPYKSNVCCLCGSEEELTGEHKVKASVLRTEFGNSPMVIGRFDDPNARVKLAQSAKSKVFHFSARMCKACNGARTQAADREFDYLHKISRDLLNNGDDPKKVLDDDRYRIGSEAYLNVFRYFAKLLCCHMAEIDAPRPVHLSRFALGRANANCVWLDIDRDWTYEKASEELGFRQYAAHGGLVVYGDKETGGANGFHSTLTVGPLRYIFFSRLNYFERIELRIAHREFHEWCRQKVLKSTDQPISEEALLRLGLSTKKLPEE